MSSKGKTRCVALLRGINVGSKNRIAMKPLIEIFAGCGCEEVSTFIQSGNILFTAPAARLKGLSDVVTERIAAEFGFRIPVVLRTLDELALITRDNPFLQAGKPEKALHVYFLADEPRDEQIAKLDPERSPGDAYTVRRKEVYLFLPNGMARTKLTNSYFDTKLGTVSTARNWATTVQLLALLDR